MSGVENDEPLITKEMVGLFIAFGGDLILLVVLLAAIDVASWAVALAVSAVVLAVFGGWIGYRWWTLRHGEETDRESGDDESTDPLGTLKARYAAGELSDEEFEAKLDQLLESDRTLEEAANADEHREADDETLEERT